MRDTESAAREALEAAAAEHDRIRVWACTGTSCKGGRALCQSPERCSREVPSSDPAAHMLGSWLIVALLCCVAAAAWVLR